MRVEDWVASLRGRGVELALQDGNLRVRAPRGVLADDERDALVERKPMIVRVLQEEADALRQSAARSLSLQQQRLWYLDRIEGGLPAYNLSGAFTLEGPLDVAALRVALADFVARHDVLGLAVTERGGEPRADYDQPTLILDQVDAAEAGLGSDEALRRWLEEQADQVLPLDRPPLVRFALVRRSPTRHVLFILVHHLVWDGRCFDLFLSQMAELYAARVESREPRLSPPAARYADFVAWQRELLSPSRLAHVAGHWDRVLGTPPPNLDLPVDHPRPALMTYRGERVPVRIEGPLLAELRALARSEQATLFLVLLTAFDAVLHRWSGQEDVVVGFPVDGRTDPRFEELIGLFVNTLVVRSRPSGSLRFVELLQRVREEFLRTSALQDTPFEWLVQRYGQRDPSRSPLFQAMFTHQHAVGRTTRWHGVEVRSFFRGTRSTYTDLSLWVREYESYVDGGLDYRTDLFDHGTVTGMIEGFLRLLSGAVAHPDLPLEALPLLGPEATGRETAGRGGVEDRALADGCYLGDLRARMLAAPEREAVVGERGGTYTYGALWQAAGRVAGALGARGVGRGDVVAVMVERATDFLPLLVGIHRAGAVYLPLDPDFPSARLELMLGDAGAALLISDQAAPPGGVAVISPEQALAHDQAPAADAPLPAADELAYLMYTSGSTGTPKAVEVEHGSLANLLRSFASLLHATPADRWLVLTTVSFDISLLELLLPLCTGAVAVVAGRGAARDPVALGKLIDGAGVTAVQATPTGWQSLFAEGWAGRLRLALGGGETFPRSLADRLLGHADEVWNVYGPTETTIWSTAGRVDADPGNVPVGRPVANTWVYVLDPTLRPVPAGMRGEVWIAGAGVARGYRARPALTEERFLPDPFRPGGRMYRTGDLGRWRADGRLEHLGRVDQQVKIDGFRIEPGEIEGALERLEEVAQAAVDVRGPPEHRRLVAYVVFREQRSLLAGDVRRRLGKVLPRYMIPGLVVPLPALPRTLNDKVDRRALPDPPSAERPKRTFEAPRAGWEETIAEVWRELLGLERVGRNDNFFELGGTSLQSIRAVVEVERRTARRIDPRDFFFRTLGQLAGS